MLTPKTKFVCTIGPASDSPAIMLKMLQTVNDAIAPAALSTTDLKEER